jgi:hypothetical protein
VDVSGRSRFEAEADHALCHGVDLSRQLVRNPAWRIPRRVFSLLSVVSTTGDTPLAEDRCRVHDGTPVKEMYGEGDEIDS